MFDYRSLIHASSALVLPLFLLGCVTVTTVEQRIDNLPMYGQPEIARPDTLKKADAEFVRQATASFGSREAASRAWFQEAERFMGAGNLDLAMRRYNQSWLLDPNNYQPYWGFARVLLEQDKFEAATAMFGKAIQLCNEPEWKGTLLSDTGSAYSYHADSIKNDQRARLFEAANSHFLAASKIDPAGANIWKRWAFSLYREGKYAESWEKIKKARALGASDTDFFLQNLSKQMPDPNP